MKEFEWSEWFEWFEWFGPSPIEPFNSDLDCGAALVSADEDREVRPAALRDLFEPAVEVLKCSRRRKVEEEENPVRLLVELDPDLS